MIPTRISSLFLLWSSLGCHQHQLQFSSSSLQSRPSRTHFRNIESNGYVLSFIFFFVSIVVGSLQAPSVVVFFSPLLSGDSYFSNISYGIFALCALSWSQCESLFHVVMHLNVRLVVVVVARFLLLADKYSPSFLCFFTIYFFFPPCFSHCGGSKCYQLWNLALRAFSCLQSHLPSFNVII